MNRQRLIDQCKRLLAEAYEEATEMIVAYLERSSEPRAAICKEIDPENWRALESRVMRLQQKRKSEGISGITSAGPALNQRASIRSAKSAIRKYPELAAELLKDPAVARAVVADREANVNLARARQEYDQEVQDQTDLHHPDRVPLRHASDHAADMNRLTQIRRELFQMAEKVMDRNPNRSQRVEGQTIAEEIAIAASRLKAAFSGSIDDELTAAIAQWRNE